MYISASSVTELLIANTFSKRYKHLTTCARNILKRVRNSDVDMIHDLISESYIYVYENRTKFEPQILTGGTEAIAVNYMNMQIHWSGSKFKSEFLYPKDSAENKKIVDLKDEEGRGLFIHLDHKIYSDENEDGYSVLSEQEMDEEEHLQQQKEEQDRVNNFSVAFEELPADKRMLFNIIYREGFDTTDKLWNYFKANNIKESRTASYYLLKEMKKYFKNKKIK